jgi:hypothetical protein
MQYVRKYAACIPGIEMGSAAFHAARWSRGRLATFIIGNLRF